MIYIVYDVRTSSQLLIIYLIYAKVSQLTCYICVNE